MPHVVGLVDTALAEAARSGDAEALDALVAECLPLVYSIVRRSLRASSDVDDVVQEVMLVVVRSLGSLRDPDRLRAWLAAVTVNEIRAYLRSGRAEHPVAERYEPYDQPDPGSEFVGHTLLQLDLSEQRREAARAATWLDPEHRDLLGLWWLEASGHLTRAELTAALGLDPHLVTVRVGRMKEQLDGCRHILRALDRGCSELMVVAADWRGEPSSVWRKRFLRHIRVCHRCLAAADGLIAPERLLAGLPLLPLPLGFPLHISGGAGAVGLGPAGAGDVGARAPSVGGGAPGTRAAPTRSRRPDPHHRGARHRAGSHRGGTGAGGKSGINLASSTLGKPIGVVATALSVLGVAAAVVVLANPASSTPPAQSLSTGQPALGTTALASPGSGIVPSAQVSRSTAPTSHSPSVSQSPMHAPSHDTSPSGHATHPAAPPPSSSIVSSGSQSPAGQVLAVINQARASAGLAPYTMNADLIKSATAHNNLMAGGCGLAHQCPGEAAIGDRETAAGVQWTSCGENIGEGGPEPDTQAAMAQMAVSLTRSMLAEKPPNDGHRLNILSSSFTEVGIAVMIDSSGTVWLTQDFAN